ncbi:MAG: tyrosine-type recombinase/integrase [Endozoicomonas sp.]
MIKDSQIRRLVREKQVGKHPVGQNLYLRISKQLKPSWLVRYTVKGSSRRKEHTIGAYPAVSLADAFVRATEVKEQAKMGVDLVLEEKQGEFDVKTMNDLFEVWLEFKKKNIKSWHLQAGRYRREIKLSIGQYPPENVKAVQIREVLERIYKSGRPAVANDVLSDLKGMFSYGQKLQMMQVNPTEHFTVSDAGGIEEGRERYLTAEEVKLVFEAMRATSMMSRDNYLSCALLLVLAVRKMELFGARFREFDFKEAIWRFPSERITSKTKRPPLRIPLESEVIEWLTELKYRSCGSEFVFPNRRPRSSKRFDHVSPDTLNTAIDKMFKLGLFPQGLERFTVHDLRRSARTLMSDLGIFPWVAESCLGHKIRGVEGIYNKDEFYTERRKAQRQLLDKVAPLINATG